MLRFTLHDATGPREAAFEPTAMVIAGWAARDRAAIDHHIEELAAIGVPRPSSVPLFYRVAAATLTQSDTIECVGAGSSGEVEPVLVRAQGRWWLTVGSDHTDREAEAHGVALSKQLCAKPLARQAWDWSELAARADGLQLRSEVHEVGQWVAYQQGALERIRPLASLLDGLPDDVAVEDGLVLFCGTLGALPDAQGRGVRPATQMRLQLSDPAGGRRIDHAYRCRVLRPVA